MKNSWSKEDKHHYNKSEVMQELEKKVIENISRLDILSKKAQQGLQQKQQQAEKLVQTLEKADQLIGDAAHDSKELKAGDSKEHHNVVVEVEGDGDFEPSKEGDDASDEIKEAALGELKQLAKMAIDRGNYKLAYKIERTIDEITEETVSCEL